MNDRRDLRESVRAAVGLDQAEIGETQVEPALGGWSGAVFRMLPALRARASGSVADEELVEDRAGRGLMFSPLPRYAPMREPDVGPGTAQRARADVAVRLSSGFGS